MTKREGEEYITQDNPGDDNGNGSWGATSGPPRLPAVQLAKRRFAQPRGARRPAAVGTRRPLPSPSPASSSQQQFPAFGQSNGAQQSPSGGFTFGQQQQPSASASFPPFGSGNIGGNSSIFTPPSSSFNFGSQVATNPFATNPTFGSTTGERDQSSAQVDTSSGSNLFQQTANVAKANEATAGINAQATTSNVGGYSLFNSSPNPNPPQKPQRLHLRPPKPPGENTPKWDVDKDGYPIQPAGPKGLKQSNTSATPRAVPSPSPKTTSSGIVSEETATSRPGPPRSGDVDKTAPPRMATTGSTGNFLATTEGTADRKPDEMDTNFEDALVLAMSRLSLVTNVQESYNTDNMETEPTVTTGPAHNPFSNSTPIQPNSIFSNAGKPAQPQFNFNQPTTSIQLPQTSSSPFVSSQAMTTASAPPQQNSLFGTAFGQPNSAMQTQLNSNSDVMMSSPEKNVDRPLGKSLFDRIERPPTDASSSPATTSTAPPPAFPFTQNSSLFTNSQQNLQSTLNGMSEDRQTLPAPAVGDNSFSGNNTPEAPMIDQSAEGERSQSHFVAQSTSPTKPESQIAEPKGHVEDKPSQDNLFSNLFMPKEQSSTALSSNALSPFMPKTLASTTPVSITQSSTGIFGTPINQGAPVEQGSSKPLGQAIDTQGSASLGGAAGNHGADRQAGTSFHGIQNSSVNKTGMFNFLKPPTDVAESSTTGPRDVNKNGSLKMSRSRDDPNTVVPTEPAIVTNNAIDHDYQHSKFGHTHPESAAPADWTAVEKKQYYVAYRLKQLDVGAEAKRLALIKAKHTHKIKHLKRFYRKTERSIKSADGGNVRPVTRSPSPDTAGSELDDDHSVWPPIRQGSLKRPNDKQEGIASASADMSSDNRNQKPSGNPKRARITEDQQVSYPSLPSAAPNSNTSSMFKNILDKASVISNDDPSTGLSESSSKTSDTNSSVLDNGNKNPASQLASNPFAASIAKWQADSTRVSSEDGATVVKPATSSSSPFAFKPVINDVNASGTSESSFKPPTLTSNNPTNFLAQFGQSSKNHAKEEMEKRKAADMDSDEDEAEWERRDAEQQRAKKQKVEQEASKLKPTFVPGKGFTFEPSQDDNDKPSRAQSTPKSVDALHELDRKHVEFAKRQAAAADASNPFAKYLKQDSGNEGSKSGDADDEQEGSDDDEEQETSADKSTGKSLFGRINAPTSKFNKDTKDDDNQFEASNEGVNIFGHLSGAAAPVSGTTAVNKSASPAKANPFGKLPSSNPSQNVFGTPASANTLNTPKSGEKADHTWKPESPIKFASNVDASSKKRARNDEDDIENGRENPKRANVHNAPTVNITSPSPTKAPSGSLFGDVKPSHATETSGKLASKPSAATQGTSTGSTFGFEISPMKPASALGSLFPPSSNPSNGVSRSTSPGATTGESATESNADGDDEETEKHEQLNLTSGGPGEEDEDVLYEVRAKASVWVETQSEKEEKTGAWETKGLGPFRIMKNRKTKKARMLMRSDPAGRIIINSSIYKQFKYDAPTKSTCRLPMLSAAQKLENWVIKIGKDSDAGDIARILEENKDL